MLYIMSIELGSTGDMITYREKEKDFLVSVKSGCFRKSDGMYNEAFFDMVNDYKKKLDYVRKNTILPVKVDMKKAQEFIMEVNRKTLSY